MKYRKITIWRAFLPKTNCFSHPPRIYPPSIPAGPTLLTVSGPLGQPPARTHHAPHARSPHRRSPRRPPTDMWRGRSRGGEAKARHRRLLELQGRRKAMCALTAAKGRARAQGQGVGGCSACCESTMDSVATHPRDALTHAPPRHLPHGGRATGGAHSSCRRLPWRLPQPRHHGTLSRHPLSRASSTWVAHRPPNPAPACSARRRVGGSEPPAWLPYAVPPLHRGPRALASVPNCSTAVNRGLLNSVINSVGGYINCAACILEANYCCITWSRIQYTYNQNLNWSNLFFMRMDLGFYYKFSLFCILLDFILLEINIQCCSSTTLCYSSSAKFSLKLLLYLKK
jgi:hypothetical protein